MPCCLRWRCQDSSPHISGWFRFLHTEVESNITTTTVISHHRQDHTAKSVKMVSTREDTSFLSRYVSRSSAAQRVLGRL